MAIRELIVKIVKKFFGRKQKDTIPEREDRSNPRNEPPKDIYPLW